MNVTIPPAIRHMSPVLLEFFEGMAHKLAVNSHKDAIDDRSVESLVDMLMGELQEFKDQLGVDARDPNTLSELHDMGNFCFLLYQFVRSKGVMDLRERFIRDFYTVDVASGRILCKQTRSGSPLRVGDEVRGTERNGVVYIRAQHSASGAAIYLARRDIVWWSHHGSWPVGSLRYRDGGKYIERVGDADYTPDRLSNLLPPVAKEESRFPFVSRYAPRGREHTKNWGRYVYQRRHNYKLVRLGYWDSEEEAAVKGLAAWKEATRGAVQS